ncbi:hypothetical protein SAY86_004920 [Trapa natans]|uniref:Uncharacterized protein n=1 Tax=Trapa natans TaxID=22666 RepID=A0AAN7N7J2_TRANT|nr:hypothetical protein SAY86_004920 [Trapa natans]
MGRNSCLVKQKLRKGLWSPEEDEKLFNHMILYGTNGCWSSVPRLAGLQRCGKSCRLRWLNYLRPDLKRGTFSREEEEVIINLHRVLGNRWAQIAANLPGRTDNEVKNFWNSYLKKKLMKQGIDPATHRPLEPLPRPPKEKEQTLSTALPMHEPIFLVDGIGSGDNSECSLPFFEFQAGKIELDPRVCNPSLMMDRDGSNRADEFPPMPCLTSFENSSSSRECCSNVTNISSGFMANGALDCLFEFHVKDEDGLNSDSWNLEEQLMMTDYHQLASLSEDLSLDQIISP